MVSEAIAGGDLRVRSDDQIFQHYISIKEILEHLYQIIITIHLQRNIQRAQ